MIEVLSPRRDASGHLGAMEKAVTKFVDEAPRSDDLTMLYIHYIMTEPGVIKRHLTLENNIEQIPRLSKFIAGIAESKKLDEDLTMNM